MAQYVSSLMFSTLLLISFSIVLTFLPPPPGKCTASVSLLRRVFHQAGGVDRAADLIEHYSQVGYDHLIPAYAKYNWSWIQYHNTDVHVTILVVLAIVSFILFKLCLCVCRRCRYSVDVIDSIRPRSKVHVD